MKKKRSSMIYLKITEKSAADLRGRQSVRTTFRLSERTIEALSILAGQLGIKQKSLFDHLMDDTHSLKIIAREFEAFGSRTQRVAKTYVVSRKTLENLERVSLQYGTPRDALVEYSIDRILPLIAQEKEKHEKRKQVLAELRTYLEQGAGILGKAEKDLGEDDPVFLELLHMMRGVESCFKNVESSVVKGAKMEDF